MRRRALSVVCCCCVAEVCCGWLCSCFRSLSACRCVRLDGLCRSLLDLGVCGVCGCLLSVCVRCCVYVVVYCLLCAVNVYNELCGYIAIRCC